MSSVEKVNTPAPNTRIDLYRMTVGADSENNQLEVLAVYLHTLASFLPISVIKTMLKHEFEPEDLRLLLSRRVAAELENLNALFLNKTRQSARKPLRSERYGAPPKPVLWHFFPIQDSDALVGILKSLP